MRKTYTQEEINERAFYRTARIFYELWEEGSGIHTRLFDLLISDEVVTVGESINGRGHREHLVPCVAIVKQSKKMFGEGATIEDVSVMIKRNLKIAHITKDEARKLDVI